MSVLPLFIAPDPVLKRRAEEVDTVDDALRTLIDDMLETMYAERGIGLAAPQVGVGRRVLVLDVADDGAEARPMAFINPEIVWQSAEEVAAEEGCLSVPGQYSEVIRPERIRVRYLDRDGRESEIEADGLLARCLQHEMDHLDGTLFVDHLSQLKRNMLLRKLKKERARGRPEPNPKEHAAL